MSVKPRPVVSSGMTRQPVPRPAPVNVESSPAAALMPVESSGSRTVPAPSGTGRGSIEPARRQVYNVRFSAEESFKEKLERLAEVLGVFDPQREMAALLERALDIALEKKDPQKRLERREKRARAAKSSPRPDKGKTGHRSRSVPVAVRDHILARSGYQCEYRGSDGTRCRARTGLAIDHRFAYARGGSHDELNPRALCEAHNLLCAEKDFGVEFVRKRISGARNRARVRLLGKPSPAAIPTADANPGVEGRARNLHRPRDASRRVSRVH